MIKHGLDFIFELFYHEVFVNSNKIKNNKIETSLSKFLVITIKIPFWRYRLK